MYLGPWAMLESQCQQWDLSTGSWAAQYQLTFWKGWTLRSAM